MIRNDARRPTLDSGSNKLPLIQAVMLACILLTAAWLRVESHNWDQGQHINVDELSVTKVAIKRVNVPAGSTLSDLLDPRTSPLNPRAEGALFVYGALPLYMVKGVSSATAAITGDRYFVGLDGVQQTGRVLAGLLDTLIALMVFGVGFRLWGVWQGLLASALYALAILPIQTSHFFISDPFMACFMAATLLCSLLFYQTQRRRYILLAGLCAGLATACKLSAAPVVALPLFTTLLLTFRNWRATSERGVWARGLAWVGLAMGGALMGLFIGDPFAVLNMPTYLAQIAAEAQIQGGATDVWFTRKYVGTWPVLHLLGQLFLLGAGPIVGLAGIGGLGVVVARVWREKWVAESSLLVGAALYFILIAALDTKWVRYLLPLAPYLCLCATAFAFWACELAVRRAKGRLRWVVAGTLLASGLVGAVAVNSIFRSEHTQVKASEWILSNVPAGGRIGIEKTAIEMPLPLPGSDEKRKGYIFLKMDPLADMPSQEASNTLRSQLHDVDYLVIDATQAAGTAPRLPWRYPVQTRYYDLLLGGRLGFSVALHSTSYPRIGGLEIADDGGWVDPSFMDSSHPPIWVLKKERDLSEGEWSALFADAVRQPSVASRQRP